MIRIAQLLGIVLALSLGLADPSSTSESVSNLSSSFSEAGGLEWLETLRDNSMPLSERLELAASDVSITTWTRAVAARIPSIDEHGLKQLRELPDLPKDPFSIEIARGFRGMMEGLEFIVFDGVHEQAKMAIDLKQDLDLTELLTDPTVPAIVGDEWANFLEGLVALIGAVFVYRSEPSLAQDLATAFADRMQRTPRLFALCGLEGYVEVRDGWQSYLSEEDRQTLARDRAVSERYVSGLTTLAVHGSLS
jgi:hypothetical protein